MCGIIGGISETVITPVLLAGLSYLDYRGYDSAGIAVAVNQKIDCFTVVGRVGELKRQVVGIEATMGMGHTRWATHGAPTLVNAHPIRCGRIVIAHNGIVENYLSLRDRLPKNCCIGETDTEVVGHLINQALNEKKSLLMAVHEVCQQLSGAYAFTVMEEGQREIICVRNGSPLLIGQGKTGVFVASDVHAFMGKVDKVYYLKEGEIALLTDTQIQVFDATQQQQEPHWIVIALDNIATVELGPYTHFMQKEIFEQPDVIISTMEHFVESESLPLNRFGRGASTAFRRAHQVVIIACGTSYHAGMVARYWFERFHIPCRVEIASEYRYRHDPQASSSLAIFVSQSGETADTLSAMRFAKQAGATTLAVVNVETSTMAREADFTFFTRVGVEIGVASTKAFTAQLVALLLLVLAMAKAKKQLDEKVELDTLRSLKQLPHLMRKALLLEDELHAWAQKLALTKSVVFIGRHVHYPMVLEGALKLKEISYIHAEGCAAGELKHGLLALIDANTPVVGLVANNSLLPKMMSNLNEISSRDGPLYVLAEQPFAMPKARVLHVDGGGNEFLSPLVFALPLQLLAYHTARQKGTDIDKPRNLAKSVTVE